jgi:hypothetical protein
MAGEVIQYQTEDGVTVIRLQARDGNVWRSQVEIAELFRVTPQVVAQHLRAIYEDGELDQAATCNDYLQVRAEEKPEVSCQIAQYSLRLKVQARQAAKKFDAEYDRWHARAINAPSPIEQHFVEAIGKVKQIEAGKPKAARKGKGDQS